MRTSPCSLAFLIVLMSTGLAVAAETASAPASPATAESQPAAKKKTGTLVGKVVDKKGAAVEKATVYVYIRKPTRDSNLTRVAQGITKADGTFEIQVQAGNDLVVNIMGQGPDAWGKGGINVTAGEKTDLGEIKIGALRM